MNTRTGGGISRQSGIIQAYAALSEVGLHGDQPVEITIKGADGVVRNFQAPASLIQSWRDTTGLSAFGVTDTKLGDRKFGRDDVINNFGEVGLDGSRFDMMLADGILPQGQGQYLEASTVLPALAKAGLGVDQRQHA